MSVASSWVLGYSGNRLPAVGSSALPCKANRCSCTAATGWRRSTLPPTANSGRRDQATRSASARPARTATARIHRSALLLRPAPCSTGCVCRRAHRCAVEFVEQQDMLRRAAVFAARAAAFIMAEAVFVDQEEADFHPIEAAHFSSRLHFAAGGSVPRCPAGLVADPDVEIRAAALADRRGAAHRVDAGDRQLAAGRFVKRAAPFVF